MSLGRQLLVADYNNDSIFDFYIADTNYLLLALIGLHFPKCYRKLLVNYPDYNYCIASLRNIYPLNILRIYI